MTLPALAKRSVTSNEVPSANGRFSPATAMRGPHGARLTGLPGGRASASSAAPLASRIVVAAAPLAVAETSRSGALPVLSRGP